MIAAPQSVCQTSVSDIELVSDSSTPALCYVQSDVDTVLVAFISDIYLSVFKMKCASLCVSLVPRVFRVPVGA